MILATRHTGVVVRDLDAAIAFYTGLGPTVWKRRVEEGPYVDALVGLDDVRLEWAKLRVPDGSLIELLMYHSHPERRPVERTPSNRLGCSHIAFTVSEVLVACRTVEALGGHVVNPPVLSPDGYARVAYVHDPEGNLIELVEVVA